VGEPAKKGGANFFCLDFFCSFFASRQKRKQGVEQPKAIQRINASTRNWEFNQINKSPSFSRHSLHEQSDNAFHTPV
jgi:hypothetical protein